MPGGKTPGPSIKNPAQYEAVKAKLQRGGMGAKAAKAHAAKISNASAHRGGRSRSGRRR